MFVAAQRGVRASSVAGSVRLFGLFCFAGSAGQICLSARASARQKPLQAARRSAQIQSLHQTNWGLFVF